MSKFDYEVWPQRDPRGMLEYSYVDSLGKQYRAATDDDKYDARTDSYAELPDMVSFTDVAIGLIGQQNQYASNYLSGRNGYPNLATGLRLHGELDDYHSLAIHFQDMPALFERLVAYRAARGIVDEYESDTKRQATPQEQEWGRMLLAGQPLLLQVE